MGLFAGCCLLLLQGCGGDAAAQDAGAGVLALRADSTGQLVGTVVDLAGRDTDEMRVLKTINGRLTVIVIGASGSNGERGIVQESLYYAAADCTGTPYSTVRSLVTNKLTARHAGRWYVADREADKAGFAYASRSVADDCFVTSAVDVGAPAIELSSEQSAVIDGYVGPYYEAVLVSSSLEVPGL